MVDLSPQDLDGKILDCAAGPASFNAKATQQGSRVTYCDPIYRFTVEEISNRIDETYDTVVTGAKANLDRYLRLGGDRLAGPYGRGQDGSHASFLGRLPTRIGERVLPSRQTTLARFQRW